MNVLNPAPDLRLRPLTEADAPELYALTDRNRDHLAQFLPWVASTNQVSDTLKFIRESIQHWEALTGAPFGIFLNERLIGTIGIKDIAGGSGEIGYWLSREVVGQGVMTTAAREVVNFGFDKLKLDKLYIFCLPHNVRSAAVARRLGFEYDGTADRLEPGSRIRRQLDRYKKIRRPQ